MMPAKMEEHARIKVRIDGALVQTTVGRVLLGGNSSGDDAVRGCQQVDDQEGNDEADRRRLSAGGTS